MRSRWVASAAMITVAGLALAGCAGSSGDEGGDDNTLTLWHYESETSAMGVAWAEAIKVFEEETGAKVEFEEKSFEQIRSTASQVLNSNEAPDILEYNKGNATAGLLSSEGLLTPLTEQVEEFGWDDKLAPALQTTARYSEDGVMGSGEWYGVPNYGEYVTMYYNKDAFAAQGIEIPTTRDELEAAMQKFVDAGITPLAEAGLEYPLGQLWYQLALAEADRQFVNDYQLYENEVDWHDDALTTATETAARLDGEGLHLARLVGSQGRGCRCRLHQRRGTDVLLRQLVVRPHGQRDRGLRLGHLPVPGH